MTFYRQFIHDAPPEPGAFFGFHMGPPLPFIPPERVGEPMCAVFVCHTVFVCYTGDPGNLFRQKQNITPE